MDMDVEELATTAVIRCIARTKYLSPSIRTKDREVSWDGNIYIHKERKQSKEGVTRIPVQVKGRDCNDKNITIIDENTISYPVSTIDLTNYYKDGGTIYFLVTIQESPYQESIYYAKLLPVDINEYLKNADAQKTIHVKFKAFPSKNPSEVEMLIIRISKERQEQFSSINCTKEDLERYKSGKYPLQFTLNLSPDASVLQEINLQQPYIRAIIDNNISVPVGKLSSIYSIQTQIDGEISINGRVFYTTFKYIEDIDKNKTFIFGNIIKYIKFPPENGSKIGSGKIDFNFIGTLNEQLRDLDFYCSAVSNNGFEINGMKQKFQLFDDINSLNKSKEVLDFLNRFREALNNAGYLEDLSFEGFDGNAKQFADDFVSIFVDKKEINYKELPEGSYFYSIRFGKNILPIYVEKYDGHCIIKNPYKTLPLVFVHEETGERYIIPRYISCHEKLFYIFTYLDCNLILDAFTKVEIYAFSHEKLTLFLLKILKACDNNAPLKDKYLEFSMKLASWLYTNSVKLDKNCQEISLLNLMQIKKRINQRLDQNDINQLYDLLDNHQMSERNKTGLFILVENFIKAKYSFSTMSPYDQKVFLTFPIMHFWDYEKYPLPQVSSQEDNPAGETTEGAD